MNLFIDSVQNKNSKKGEHMTNTAKKILTVFLVLAICINFSFAAGTLSTNKMTIAGKERTYLVYLPDGYTTSKTYPLVFMFHGLGGTAQGAASSYYGITELADQKGFIAVFPDSLKDLPPKDFKLFFYSVKGYDTINGNKARWDIAHIQASDRYNTQDTDFVKGILSTMKTNYKISSDHVYFIGHSYGAIFAYYASMCMPEKVTAFAGASGGMVKYFVYTFPVAPRNAKTTPAYSVPGLLLHSQSDSVVPYSWDQTLYNALKSNGHPTELVTLSVTAESGHAWDKTKNEYVWNWLIGYSPALPAS
jgi:polyhydroxybutyrate depolymerase